MSDAIWKVIEETASEMWNTLACTFLVVTVVFVVVCTIAVMREERKNKR